MTNAQAAAIAASQIIGNDRGAGKIRWNEWFNHILSQIDAVDSD